MGYCLKFQLNNEKNKNTTTTNTMLVVRSCLLIQNELTTITLCCSTVHMHTAHTEWFIAFRKALLIQHSCQYCRDHIRANKSSNVRYDHESLGIDYSLDLKFGSIRIDRNRSHRLHWLQSFVWRPPFLWPTRFMPKNGWIRFCFHLEGW